jgi:hypothetical protein
MRSQVVLTVLVATDFDQAGIACMSRLTPKMLIMRFML